MLKTALVLEGGASRAYFSNGVMDCLMDNDIYANYVIGTSAGIANGLSYVSRQRGRSLELGKKYMNDKRYMGLKYMFKPGNRSYYNIKFVFDDLPNIYLPYDYEAFENFDGNVIATVTNIETGKAEYLEVPRTDRTWRAVMASCALPLAFQPVKIDGNLYMDGGMTDSIPFQKPIDDGCDKIIVILTRERGYVKKSEPLQKIIDITYRRYPNLVKSVDNRAQMYNEARKRIFELESRGKLFVIEPETTGNFSRVESSPEALCALYDQGYNVANARMSALKAYLEA